MAGKALPIKETVDTTTERTVFHRMIHGVVTEPVNTSGEYVHTPFPQQLVIEATASCNMACIFCGRTYMDRTKAHMPRPIWDKIVEEVGRESPYTEIWPAFMGESTLLGDELYDRLAYARKAGCKKITLNTNGTLINKETIPRVLEGNWDRFIVSCDAVTDKTHDLVRPQRGRKHVPLSEIFRNVELLIQEQKRRKLDRPLVEMQFSVFDENEGEVEAFIDHWLSRGVVVKTRPKLYWTGLVPTGDTERITVGPERTPCMWSLETACILNNGNVVMCAIDSEAKFVAGNVTMQSFKEIWNGPLKWIRELHMQKRFRDLPEICRKCPDWQVKRANAYFPTPEVRRRYEQYVRMGRVFMQDHNAPTDQYVALERPPKP